MKKGLFVVMVALCLPFFANAQYWLTVKGGGGLATYSSDMDINPGLAINSGIGYKHQMTNFMILEGDILLDTRSNEFSTGNLDAAGNTIYFASSATYIQIPITAHFNWLLEREELVPYRMYDSKTSFYVEGGPYFAYALSQTPWINPSIVAVWEGTEEPVAEANQSTKDIDYGVTVGLGLSYEFENMNKMNIGGRLNYGLNDIYKDEKLGSANNLAAVGHISFDFALTKRRHIKHRW